MKCKTSLMILLVMAVGVLPCFASANTRLALVIGNSAYTKNALDNPRNDAADMAAMLRKVDFEVTHLADLDRRGMAKGISQFSRKLEKIGAVGLFYYAGHGAEVNGINYLLPLGMQVENSSELEYEAINVQRLLGQMEQARNGLNIVMIDACRNNPFRSFRGGDSSRGLKRMNAPLGSIISSSTASGEVAADGVERNSPYTKQLLANMDTPGLGLGQFFMRVRVGVLADTGGTQVPWEMSSLTENFFFRPATDPQPNQEDSSVISNVPTPVPVIVAGGIDIDSLLEECEAHFKANRLTSSAGGNALECYTEVLGIRPGQPDALRGLTKIEDKYITWARREVKRSNPAKALGYLERLKSVNTDRGAVGELEEAIALLQASQLENVIQSPLACYRLGPFNDKNRLAYVLSKLEREGVRYTIEDREEAKNIKAARIYLGTYATLPALELDKKRLETLDIDHFVIRVNGALLLQLGYFSSVTTALEYQKSFKSRGLEAKVETIYYEGKMEGWVEVQLASSNTIKALDLPKGMKINEQVCQK